MKNYLIRTWYAPQLNCLSFLLLPFSYLFRCIVFLRRTLYRIGIFRSYSVPVPVIVVGNLTVGGTGKTPCVIALAQYFSAAGFRVGIISRGYGAKHRLNPRHVFLVKPDADPMFVGDEPVLIAKKTQCFVAVCAHRVKAARFLYEKHQCNLILSDDGLQHYALKRNVEIVVVDGKRGFGNGYCLPAGPLREPKSRLNSVDFLIQKTDRLGQASDKYFEMVVEPDGFYSVHDDQPHTFEPGQKVQAVAGIGHPAQFFETLRSLGLDVTPHVFPDHYCFKPEDILFNLNDNVVMTQKDAIKCRSLVQGRYYYLAIQAKLPCYFLEKLQCLMKG